MPVLGAAAGGGSSVSPRVIYFSSSTTYTPTLALDAIVHVFGGGGSGGGGGNTTSSKWKIACGGGGAGEHAAVKMTLAAGTTYTITCGAGGASSNVTAGNTVQGSAGGNSSFTASGISISANGGSGGAATNTQNNSNTITAAGGAGGTGGSSSGVSDLIRYAGGRGGNASIQGLTNSCAVGGGGAVGITGAGNRAGDVTITNAVKSTKWASYGSNTGSSSVDATSSSPGTGYNYGESTDLQLVKAALDVSVDLKGNAIGLSPPSGLTDSERELLLFTPIIPSGTISAPHVFSDIGNGASISSYKSGQGTTYNYTSNAGYVSYLTPGRFAGGAGGLSTNYTYYSGTGGMFGGGSGGNAQTGNTSGYNTLYHSTGTGGPGGVIIEILGVG